MKKVLLYYSFSFSFGGGEHLPLALVEALHRECDLTVALDMRPNFERSVQLLGFDIDLSKVRVVQVTPPGYSQRNHTLKDSLYRSRRLKALAREADACISTANIMDFGRPAHHFINMLDIGDEAFAEFAIHANGPKGPSPIAKLKRIAMDGILRPALGIRSKKAMIRDNRECIYPNSRFVEGLMKQFYGPFNSTVFYPPTVFEPNRTDAARDPLKVVYIGRIIPEKRIVDLIGIVEKARAATGLPITFQLAGRIDQTPAYGERLKAMAQERSWLKFVGPQYGEDKDRFLLSGSYALHAERIEAFGISVAEYLKAGCVPIVPDEGGSREVVDNPSLAYRTDGDAAGILARLLTDDAFRAKQKASCAARAKFFSKEAYLARQREILRKIVGD